MSSSAALALKSRKSSISNEELVASFNQWVDSENPRRAAEGLEPLAKSDVDFIVYASGVKTRHVIEREGILDPDAHDAAHSAARRRRIVGGGGVRR